MPSENSELSKSDEKEVNSCKIGGAKNVDQQINSAELLSAGICHLPQRATVFASGLLVLAVTPSRG